MHNGRLSGFHGIFKLHFLCSRPLRFNDWIHELQLMCGWPIFRGRISKLHELSCGALLHRRFNVIMYRMCRRYFSGDIGLIGDLCELRDRHLLRRLSLSVPNLFGRQIWRKC